MIIAVTSNNAEYSTVLYLIQKTPKLLQFFAVCQDFSRNKDLFSFLFDFPIINVLMDQRGLDNLLVLETAWWSFLITNQEFSHVVHFGREKWDLSQHLACLCLILSYCKSNNYYKHSKIKLFFVVDSSLVHICLCFFSCNDKL